MKFWITEVIVLGMEVIRAHFPRNQQLDVKLTYVHSNVTSSVYIVSYTTLIPVNLSSLSDGHHTYMS